MGSLVRIASALLVLLAVGCDGEDADGGEAVCGMIESPCCETAPACWGEYVAADLDGEGGQGCFCFLPANVVLCDGEEYPQFEGVEVGCGDVGSGDGVGACLADQDMEPVECDPESPCTTASDDPDGICLSDGTDTHCLSACTPEPQCPLGHSCVAFEEDAQLCAICVSDGFLADHQASS
ncbi:MAG: hypothetical protein M0R80_12980 [Proteobacteria bacterium]|jgi:hypothetical protein|nr:hypothetical protein [Pseudomonadota bacterium]